MNREYREQAADRLRAVWDQSQRLRPGDNQWLTREVAVQKLVVMARPDTRERLSMDERKQRSFATDATFHAWVEYEARVAAELALARALNLAVADADVATFLRERERLLDTEAKRRRFTEDEDYERAVFVMALAAVQDQQDGRLSQQLRDLYLLDPREVSIAHNWPGPFPIQDSRR